MSSTRVMEAGRLARVKLRCVTEPGDLRVTGLVSEAGAGKILGYLEASLIRPSAITAGFSSPGPTRSSLIDVFSLA